MPKRYFGFFLILLVICIASPVVAQDLPHYRQIAQIGRPPLKTLAWHPGGEIIGAATAEDVWLYTADSLEDVAHLDLRSHSTITHWPYEGELRPVERYVINDITWSPGGRWLLVRQGVVLPDAGWVADHWQVWEYADGSFARLLPDTVIEELQWHPADAQFAVVESGQMRIFDAETQERLAVFPGDSVHYSPDGSHIALIHEGQIEVYRTSTLDHQHTLTGDFSGVDTFWWSPDSSKIAARTAGEMFAPDGGRVFFWDIHTGERIAVFQSELTPHPFENAPPTVPAPIDQAVWRGDSQGLAIVTRSLIRGYDDTVTLWDVETVTTLRARRVGLARMTLAWSPNGNGLVFRGVAASGYPNAGIMYANNVDLVVDDFWESQWVLSPNGDLLAATRYTHNQVNIYDFNTRDLLDTLSGYGDLVRSIAWHPDGTRLATASTDEIQVWDLETSTLVANNIAHLGYWTSVIGWSHDGRYFAAWTASSLGSHRVLSCKSVRIWDMDEPSPVRSIRAQGNLWQAAWVPNSYHITVSTIPFSSLDTCQGNRVLKRYP